MINILVVEDEQMERKAITEMIITQLQNKIDMVVSADNGESACELFDQHDIHLVISDINIPGMSGLAMLKIMKKANPDVRVIILTGYDYFAYAQEALRIGVDDFILKPVSQHDLCDRIEKIIALIEERKPGIQLEQTTRFREIQTILQSDLIYAILYNDSPQHIERYFSIFEMEVQSAVCICLPHEMIHMEELAQISEKLGQKNFTCLFESYFDMFVFFVFYADLLTPQKLLSIRYLFERYLPESEQIGFGGIKTTTADFNLSFVEAQESLRNHNRYEEEGIGTQIVDWHITINQYAQEVVQRIKENRTAIAVDIAESLCTFLQTQNEQEVSKILEEFFIKLQEQLKKEEDLQIYLNDKEEQWIWEKVPKGEERIHILYLLKRIIEPLMIQKRKQMNKLIIEAYAYIEKNYMHAIGLNDVAKHLDVTPQYVSFLLSTGTQNNFTNILAAYRVERAKELLKGNRKIKEIAVLVGFQNQNYFSKTFKKVTGETPKEFKNRITRY